MPEAFWSQVDTTGGQDACWPWTGPLNGSGYGGFTRSGYGSGAHRVAWFLAHGDPGHLYVLHRCDNRRCCNALHLFLGDQKMNVADARAKGRANDPAKRHLGSTHGMAKLTEAGVLAIRAATERNYIMAELYGVTRSLIGQIRKRRIWTHI